MAARAGCSSTSVKLYLCSNPLDNVVERRALREEVFPRFRAHCRHELGLDLRVIDPFESVECDKWPDENSRKQMIKECRESSVGPCLLALVGPEYGTFGLPSQVAVPEYELLLQGSQQGGASTAELEKVYSRNENTVPPSYCLQPQAEKELDTCKEVFQTAVNLCVLSGKMTLEKAQGYCRSALDADLRYALDENAHKDISGRCLVYIHKVIVGAKVMSPQQTNAQDKDNVSLSSLLTPEALLTSLCDHFLFGLISPCNLQVYTTTTQCPHTYTAARRRCYADSLCHQMTSDLVKMTQHLERPKLLFTSDAFSREQSEQEELCKVTSRLYEIPRPEENNLRMYVQNEQWRPLVITGGPCTGKTVLLAHCARQIESWLQDTEPAVILYFCSPSVNPSPKHLLCSLCSQIIKHYDRYFPPNSQEDSNIDNDSISEQSSSNKNCNFAPPPPNSDSDTTISELKTHLLSLMSSLPSAKHPLVILLNSLDRMYDNYGGQVIECLPSPLPPSVKLIFTTSSKQKHIVEAVALHYPQCSMSCSESEVGREGLSLQLGLPSRKESVKMLSSLLSGSGRRITSGQQAVVNQALDTCRLPLYVRLLHQLTSLWHSDSEVIEGSLPDGVHAAVSSLLDHLELKHGSVLVAHAVCYMTLSRTGLTEAELTDLLSNNNSVLAHYTKQGLFPKMRVPQVDVETLILDLKPFLSRSTVAGSLGLFWVSRHFGLVITKRYLHSVTARRDFHSEMADYYSGRWSCGCSKPFNEDNNKDKTYIDRQPSSQPFFFTSSSNEMERTNLKKILELPHHLRESGQIEELHKLALTLHFQQAMVGSGLLSDLVAILERDGEGLGKDHSLLANILKSSVCFLNSFPSEIPSVMELLLMPYKDVLPDLEGYVNAIQQERKKNGVTLTLHSASPTVHAFKCVKPQVEGISLKDAVVTSCGTVVVNLGDGSVWVCKSNGNELVKLRLTDEHGEITFRHLHSCGDSVVLSSPTNKHFLWDVTWTDVLHKVKDSNETPTAIERIFTSLEQLCIQWKDEHFVSSYDISNATITHLYCQKLVTCLGCCSNMLLCGHTEGALSIFDMNTASLQHTCSNTKLGTVVATIVCHKNHQIGCIDETGNTALWDISTEQPKLVKETFHKEKSKIVNTDYVSEMQALLVCQSKQITLWNTSDWEVSDQFLAPKQNSFKHALLSQDGHFLLALLDKSSSVFVWKLGTGDCILSLDTSQTPQRLLKSASEIVCVNCDGSIAVWDSEMIHVAGFVSKMGRGVRQVVFDEDEDCFYTSDGSHAVWKWIVGMDRPSAYLLHCDPIKKILLSPNGCHLVTVSAEDIYIWQTECHQNIMRIAGSKAADVLITPNSKFGLSLSLNGLSRVWNLVSGATICTIRLYLSDAQISAESTFLIGLHCGELLAANLWSGFIHKQFSCDEISEKVVAFQSLRNHPNFVLVLLTSGSLYSWNIAEETVSRHFQIPVHCLPKDLQMPNNGRYALLSTHHETLTVLDLSTLQLCSFRTKGEVLISCLDSLGCNVICCSRKKLNCECFLHTRPILSVIQLKDGNTMGSLYLPKNPLSLAVGKGLCVAVGFEDGAVGMYSFDGQQPMSRKAKSHEPKCPFDYAPVTWWPQTTPNINWT